MARPNLGGRGAGGQEYFLIVSLLKHIRCRAGNTDAKESSGNGPRRGSAGNAERSRGSEDTREDIALFLLSVTPLPPSGGNCPAKKHRDLADFFRMRIDVTNSSNPEKNMLFVLVCG